MARPRIDSDAVREVLLGAAEELLREHGAQRITVVEIARHCGMSQSNAYRFFPSKRALLQAWGRRWFIEIEATTEAIATGTGLPEARCVEYLVCQYRLKRKRFESDPELFRAYVELGLANLDIVETHLRTMHRHLQSIIEDPAWQDRLGGRTATEATALIDAMTTRFRDPAQIARFAGEDSEARAAEVMRIILAGLATVSPAASPTSPQRRSRKGRSRG
jgi:TetR/AcrR family transcriptional regulator, repressor of the ameABC operon